MNGMRPQAASVKSLVAGISVLIFACAAPLHANETSSSTNVVRISDVRPIEDIETKTLSLGIWSCEYFVTRVGDPKMKIDRISMLAEDVTREVAGRGHSGVLEVSRFTLHQNSGVQMVNAAFASAAGAFGGFIPGKKASISAKCPKEKMSAGWFDAAEVENNNPPLIGEIDAQFNEKKYAVRVVYSPTINLMFRYRSSKPKYIEEYVRALRIANKALIDQILHDLAV